MPSTVKLRYVGGLMHVDFPILVREGEPLDDHGEGCLVRGETFDCDAAIAGRAPQLADDGTLAIDPDTGQPVDPGEGLLAMLGLFEVVAGRARTKKKTTRRPRKETAATSPTPDGVAADGTEKTEA